MTVTELIELLKELPGDSILVMQADSEGNGYSPMSGAEAAFYEPDSTWSGQVIDEDYLEGHDPDEIAERLAAAEPCVVVWPIN